MYHLLQGHSTNYCRWHVLEQVSMVGEYTSVGLNPLMIRNVDFVPGCLHGVGGWADKIFISFTRIQTNLIEYPLSCGAVETLN